MVARPITRHDRPQESESSDVDIARSILRLCDGGFLNLNRSYAASCLDIVTACGFYQVLTRKPTYFNRLGGPRARSCTASTCGRRICRWPLSRGLVPGVRRHCRSVLPRRASSPARLNCRRSPAFVWIGWRRCAGGSSVPQIEGCGTRPSQCSWG